jgi:hypothetical protein
MNRLIAALCAGLFLAIGVPIAAQAQLSDGVVANKQGVNSQSFPYSYNGSTFDRVRGNIDTGAIVTLTAASSSGNSADQVNYNGRGLQLGINISAISGTSPSLTVAIQGKDTASGQYYTILSSAALTSTGFYWLTVYPSPLANATAYVSQLLPRTWRILNTIAGTGPSVTAAMATGRIVQRKRRPTSKVVRLDDAVARETRRDRFE